MHPIDKFIFFSAAKAARRETEYSKEGEHLKAFKTAMEARGRGIASLPALPVVIAVSALEGIIVAIALPILGSDDLVGDEVKVAGSVSIVAVGYTAYFALGAIAPELLALSKVDKKLKGILKA